MLLIAVKRNLEERASCRAGLVSVPRPTLRSKDFRECGNSGRDHLQPSQFSYELRNFGKFYRPGDGMLPNDERARPVDSLIRRSPFAKNPKPMALLLSL